MNQPNLFLWALQTPLFFRILYRGVKMDRNHLMGIDSIMAGIGFHDKNLIIQLGILLLTMIKRIFR